jgi:hypothetical protein
MKSLYIYHHLGLGDHIICNGLVRHYYKLYDRIYLFCKSHNFSAVSYMYRDLNNLKIIKMSDYEIRQFMQINPTNNYLVIGHEEYRKAVRLNSRIIWDVFFYEQVKLNIDNKYTDFYINRDIEKEKNVYYNILKLKDNEKYIFIHDADDRKIYKNIPKDIKIIKPINKDINLFHFLYTIENAQEIHVVNSSFFNLIECMQLKHDKLFYHHYARPNEDPYIKLNWTIYK